MIYLRVNISLLHSCCANLSLFFKNRAKYALCGQNKKCLNVQTDGTHSKPVYFNGVEWKALLYCVTTV